MFSIVFSTQDFEEIRSALFTKDELENAVFVICGFTSNGDETRLFVRRLMPVPPEAYKIRTGYHLEIFPFFINKVIDAAEGKFAIGAIHSHPGALSPEYSVSDNYGESRLFTVFSDLLPSLPHASLLFSPRMVMGRFWRMGNFRKVDNVSIAGTSLRKVTLTRQSPRLAKSDKATFDRQIMAFGDEVQAKLAQLKIGIVGLGGTGSCVAEQLARMGCRDFLLVDNDNLEASNITRTYGSEESDVRKRVPKTRIASRNITSIDSGIFVQEVRSSIIQQETLLRLRDRDMIFCCTDNDLSRSLLNRYSYQYLTPVIDMGVRIVADASRVLAAAGRVSLIGPGLPCLWCSHHLDSERIRLDSLDSNERDKLLKEKYIQGAEAKAPAVISLNSTVSSLAVTMYLSLLSGFSNVPISASEQIFDAMEGVIFRSKPERDPQCRICGPTGLKGLGDTQIVSAYSSEERFRT